MMTVVGLDLSLTSTGMAVISDGSVHTYALKTKPEYGSPIRRVLHQVRVCRNLLLRFPSPYLFFIEDYAFGVKAASRLATLGEVNGIFKSFIISLTKKDPLTVPIGTWKVFLCGNGRLKSEDFKLAVFKKFGIDCKTVDEAAAVAVADLGYCYAVGKPFDGRELKKYEEKALKNFCTRVQKSIDK